MGVTVEGVPIELVAAEPERFGTALLRATGSPAYVAALEPLPDAPDEAAVYARARPPLVSAGAARGAVPRRAAGARRAGRHPRRPPLPHHVVGWPGERRGDGSRRPRARLRLHRDLRPHAGRRRRPRTHPRRRPPPGRGDRGGERRLAPFRVLRGIECDILPDGRLDLPDDVLAELDWVQASVHGGQRMPRREMTRRVEAALRNPHVRCLSHPTGRIINRRPENAVDLERVFEPRARTGRRAWR